MGGLALITERELAVLCDLAVAAGEAAMEIYGTEFAQWTKDDDSPVTRADLDSDAVIRRGLDTAFPGVFVLSEESAGDAPASIDAFFLVDPLDGTKEFLNRNGEFTVNIALISGGRAVAGVVYAPALGELFYGATGMPAGKRVGGRRAPLGVVPAAEGKPLRVIGSRSHGGAGLEAWLTTLDRPYTLVSSGSSLKFCRIAEGRADIYPRFGPTNQWDTAAAHAVLELAGGAVTDMSGAPLRYGLDRPMLNPYFTAVGDSRLLALLPGRENTSA
jgi:3'(2'), 5'-bisphosphate nucleotidase